LGDNSCDIGSRNPTTKFDHLCKQGLKYLYPGGKANAHFFASSEYDCYKKGVKPDFVLPDGRWIDFKMCASYRDKNSVPWKPSALYSSLRKYIDHPYNPTNSLIIVYLYLYGSMSDIEFPITRGSKVLIRDEKEFTNKITFVNVRDIYIRIENAGGKRVVEAIKKLDSWQYG